MYMYKIVKTRNKAAALYIHTQGSRRRHRRAYNINKNTQQQQQQEKQKQKVKPKRGVDLFILYIYPRFFEIRTYKPPPLVVKTQP